MIAALDTKSERELKKSGIRMPIRPGRMLVMVVLAIALGALDGLAQAQSDGANLLALEKPASLAPVRIDGRTLFEVRGVSAYPAAERAQVIASRIAAVAGDSSVSISSLRLSESEHSTDIWAGDQLLLSVVNADVQAEAPGMARPILAKLYLARIKAAIDSYRADRSPQYLLRATLVAAGGTLGFGLLLVALLGAFRWFTGRMERRYQSAITRFETKAHRLVRAQSIWRAVHALVRLLSIVAAIVLLFVYLHFVLALFPWTRAYAQSFRHLAAAPLSILIDKIAKSLPGLLLIGVIVVGARYVLKVAHFAFDLIKQGRLKIAAFDPEWSDSTYNIVRVLVIMFVVIVCYPFFPGSESPAFKGVTIFIGVLFSLGSSSFLANLIAGYTMTYRRAFHTGDRIKIGELMGDVTQVGLMVTHLRSVKNEEFVVPNSLILNSNVINYTSLAHEQGLILHTTVGIGYETPWRQVEAMLLMAAERTPALLRKPAPFVLQQSLGDFAVSYELNVYCDNPSAMYQLYTQLHRNILDVFNEYKVQIMTPAYMSDPSTPKIVPGGEWFAEPAQTPAVRKTGTD
jgi:small-conductance mechanosensitive channel